MRISAGDRKYGKEPSINLGAVECNKSSE